MNLRKQKHRDEALLTVFLWQPAVKGQIHTGESRLVSKGRGQCKTKRQLHQERVSWLQVCYLAALDTTRSSAVTRALRDCFYLLIIMQG